MHEEKIKEFVLTDLVKGDSSTALDSDENLLISGAIDSLGIVKLVAFLEKSFDVSISDDELLPDNFETVNAISKFLNSKIN